MRYLVLAYREQSLGMLAFLALIGCESRDDQHAAMLYDMANIPMLEGEPTRPIAAVYVLDSNKPKAVLEPSIVLVVWRSGRIIWSDDMIEGGPPYYIGRTQEQEVTNMLATLDREGILNESALSRPNRGPDSAYTVIAIIAGGKRLFMYSWHELFESNPNLVATSRGIMPLEGRTRDAVLAEQPKEYRRYRHAWSTAREQLRRLIPADSQPANDIHFRLPPIQ